MQLKIFFDKERLLAGEKVAPILFPFTGEPEWDLYHDSKLNKDAFIKYSSLGNPKLHLTGVETADYIVFPYDFSQVQLNKLLYKEEVLFYSNLSSKTGKPIILFCTNDREFEFEEFSTFSNYYLFHVSIYKSQTPPNVFTYPFFVNDTTKLYPNYSLYHDRGRPTVSFCGFAPPLHTPFNKQFLKESIRLFCYTFNIHNLFNVDVRLSYRAMAIKRILRSNRLVKNIVLRKYSGFDGRKGMFTGNSSEHYQKMRKEYFDNLNSSDYILCVRGNGNYSIRFYEAMCHGKIPIFIDSDTPLPFGNYLCWSKNAVIVKETDIKNIEKKVLQFHFDNKERLADIRRENREIWQRYLTPEGFFSHIHCLLKEKYLEADNSNETQLTEDKNH
jgi:hypothetical protein